MGLGSIYPSIGPFIAQSESRKSQNNRFRLTVVKSAIENIKLFGRSKENCPKIDYFLDSPSDPNFYDNLVAGTVGILRQLTVLGPGVSISNQSFRLLARLRLSRSMGDRRLILSGSTLHIIGRLRPVGDRPSGIATFRAARLIISRCQLLFLPPWMRWPA